MGDSLVALDGASVPDCRPGGLAPWQIRKVVRHIVENLETTTRVADLAAVAQLSASHFAHAFRASFGVAPATLVRRERVQRASQMVLANRMPLAQIALACGFSDQAHMCRLFRLQLDMPPHRWRTNMQVGGSERSRSVTEMH
jgi:transcriptional regulator GlxA family with amidase domain